MRPASLLRILALLACLGFLALGAGSFFAFQSALAAKIDHAAQIERDAARPGAAARLACVLLERRLALVSEPNSLAVSGAFSHAEASQALADYRAAGGDPSIAAEAQRAMAGDRPPSPDADIALLRAVRGLRSQAWKAPPLSRPEPPASASMARRWLLGCAVAALLSAVLAYLAGRFEPSASRDGK